MIKVCSLEFINKNTFDVDIMSSDGKLLFPAGSEITPELLLRLYYKDIYTKGRVEEEAKAKTTDIDIEEKLQTLATLQTIKEVIIDEGSKEPLEFDEEQAKRVADYSTKLGQTIGMEKKHIEELQQAAYWHNIGRTKLTKADLNKKDFKRKQAEEGYNLLIKEKKLSEKIAEAAKFYNRKYQSSQMDFKEPNYSGVPYSHIIAITSYYDELISQNMQKDEALKKMLQIGGNKFNIFILHKFITMMRNTND